MNSMTGMRGPAGAIPTKPAGLSERVPYTRRALKGDYVPSGYREGQISQFTPEQKQLFAQLFSHVSPESYLSRLAGGEEGLFEEMEEPAWRQFSEAQGQLGSRFSQLSPGAMSAQRGSGFQNQAGQLGSDFAMNLASKRQELQRQAIMDLMGLSQSLLGQRPYEKFISGKKQKQPTFLEQAGMGLLGQSGDIAKGFAGFFGG